MKKSVMMIPLLIIAVSGTITFGRRYSAAKSENLRENQVSLSESNKEEPADALDINDEVKKSEATLEDYESKRDKLTTYEYLDYKSLKNGQVKLAYYGDIRTDERWLKKITEEMKESVSGKFEWTDQSQPDSNSYDLYIEQTAEKVIDESPDLVIYGLPALPDKLRDIGLTETEEYMSKVMQRLLTMKETKVLLLEPYPMPQEIGQVNSRSLDYRSYLKRMKEVAEDFDLTIVPLHDAVEDEESYGDNYNEAGRLNDLGNQEVFKILNTVFSEEI
ncbi:SGNH/GDSL hydrolase family protein [Alkalibacterium kapii]|uniref:SGNH hydrolase-type esterase domain-containing protein n=1 Tax=Alkalibacterium kapii TaxID=426704 RepID=A0A511ARP0_9LACT|nr:SGNH/GDSL hydrolase family protein [Alkalibacterium kapii]GEK90865.1 hypothetical protein AKA01nite_04870 [Alkalibacterium kapii]